MGIRGIKWVKGQRPNRVVERKIWDDIETDMMIETDLYLIGWEVRKIINNMRLERLAKTKLLKTG